MHTCDNLCGLFGGTFDPIHYGHLVPVREVFRAVGLVKVVYIPAAVPPHRPPPRVDAEHRLAMTRIALAGEPNEPSFIVDDIELKRRGPSYTFDTVQSLRRRYPEQRYALILGLDALLGFEAWHRWQALQQSVHIIAIGRPGWQLPQPLPSWWQSARVESSAELHRSAAGKILLIEAPPIAISSTLVRERLKAGEDVSALVPAGICDYIREHHLYGVPNQSD